MLDMLRRSQRAAEARELLERALTHKSLEAWARAELEGQGNSSGAKR
jgi:hypothetical protein